MARNGISVKCNLNHRSAWQKSNGFALCRQTGVYLPVQYKLGYEKTKLAFFVVIMASPFILPLLMTMENVNPDFLSLLSPLLAYGGIALLSLGILAVSAFLSMRFYCSADLA